MKASAKDLRFHSGELLDYVGKGEEVVITYRGKPCAKLVPFIEQQSNETEDELFGMWSDKSGIDDVNTYVRDKRKGRSL